MKVDYHTCTNTILDKGVLTCGQLCLHEEAAVSAHNEQLHAVTDELDSSVSHRELSVYMW